MNDSSSRIDGAHSKPPGRSEVWILLSFVVVAESLFACRVGRLDTLDARLVYGPDQALVVLRRLSEQSRSAYRVFNLADFAFIILYSTMLVKWLRVLAREVTGAAVLLPLLGLLPGLFDLVESVGVALLLRSTQPATSLGLWLAVVGTPLKWCATILVLLRLALGEVRLWQKRRQRSLSLLRTP